MDARYIVFNREEYDPDKIGRFTYGKIYIIGLVSAINSTIGLYKLNIKDDSNDTQMFYAAKSADLKVDSLDWKEYDIWEYFDTIEEWRERQLSTLL